MTGVCWVNLICIRAHFKWHDESYGQVAWDEDMDESEYCSGLLRDTAVLSVIECNGEVTAVNNRQTVYYVRQKRRYMFSPCLSVCLSVSKITQKHVHGFGWNVACRQNVGTWTNWLTFEPDPDHSPDAGTGLLSPISYMRCYAEFYVGKIPARCYSEPWF